MQIDSFLGIHNTSPSRSIPNNALADAVDVDIDDAGIISKRPGNSLAASLAISSAYSTLGRTAYVVSGGNLLRVLDNASTITLAACTADEFCDAGKVLFTNDGLRVEDDIAVNIKLPTPTLPPQLELIDGTLPAGTYSACYTYRVSNGLESGSSPVTSIDLDAFGGINFVNTPDVSGYSITYYLTEANGTVFYDAYGNQLDTYQTLAESFPDDADKIAWHDSKLYLSRVLANGSTQVLFSKPYRPHWYDYTKDYIIIPGQVRAMASVPEALIIGTDAAIYAFDGISSAPKLADYGVISGRPFARTINGKVFMHTHRGQCVALPFENITERKVSQPPGVQCATAIVEHDGMEQFIVVSDGSGTAFNKRS